MAYDVNNLFWIRKCIRIRCCNRMVVTYFYKITVTKGKKEYSYRIVDTYKTILKRVKRHYKEGADAVEMELLKEIKLDFG
jgi:hypothetical protein